MPLPNFVLDNEHEFEWTIKVMVPIDGKHREARFKARFRHVTPQRRLEILEAFREAQLARNAELNSEEETEEALSPAGRTEHLTFEHDLLDEVVVGFTGVKTKDGEELRFDEDNKRSLIDNDYARSALLDAYMKALQGRAPEKNSRRR